ncbi:hypothetical protein DFS34DRAFT_594558 [Phlyctochytrium arcticum]|nr:hypothetical protein DFS34DRAFT_594558 [Phlyctochytrium arcticum]
MLADQSLARFASDPSHPFFRFGMEIWKRKLRVEATPDEPVPFRTIDYLPGEDEDENDERQRRIALKHAKRMAEEHGRWGMMSLPDGSEESFVTGVLNLRQELFMPPESLNGDLEDSPEYPTQCKELLSTLGSRWLRSATLLQVVGRLVDKLERAPTYDVGGGESVLDWRTDKWREMEAVLAHIAKFDRKYMEHHGLKFDWYDRYRQLRVHSTLAIEEAQFRRQCLLEQNKRQNEDEESLVSELLAISASAIYLDWVAKYIANFQTELLSCEYLAGKIIFGRFNPSGTHLTAGIILPNPVTLLFPRQCQTLAKRYLSEIMHAKLPMTKRTESILEFNKLPITDTRVLAELLIMPRIPTELLEIILMHLPNCPEPACGIPILLSPTYLRSEFANACILAVKGCLKFAPRSDILKYLQPLFPPAEEKEQRITVQKEAIRLMFNYLEEPDIRDLIGALHTRPALHQDVRIVLLNSMIAIVGSGQWEHHPFEKLAWSILSNAATDPALRINGVCDTLLRVQKPSQGTATRKVGNVTQDYAGSLLMDIVNLPDRIDIPSRLQARYLNDVLRPLTSRVNVTEMTKHEDAALFEGRQAAYLEISSSWVNTENASELAGEWYSAWEDSFRISEASSDTKEVDIRLLLAKGVGVCAYHDQSGKAWDILVSILRNWASVVADSAIPDKRRAEAQESIRNLWLGGEFLTRDSPSPEWDAMSLVEPLMDYDICGLFWEAIVERHINSASLQESVSAHAASELIVKITRVAEMYGEATTFIRDYVRSHLLEELDKSRLQDVFSTLFDSSNGSLSDTRFSMALKVAFFDMSPNIFRNEIIEWFLDVTNPHSNHHAYYLDNATQCQALLSKSLPTDPLMNFLANRPSGGCASNEHNDDGNLVVSAVARAKEAGWERIHGSTLLEILKIAPFACIKFQADNLGSFINHQIVTYPRGASSTIGHVLRHIGLYLQTEGMRTDKVLSANLGTANAAVARFATHLIDGYLLRWDLQRNVQSDNLPDFYSDAACFALAIQKQTSIEGGLPEVQQTIAEHERSITTVQDAQRLWDASVGSTVSETPSASYSDSAKRAYRQVPFEFLNADHNAQAVLYNPRAYMAFMRSCLSEIHPLYSPVQLAEVIVDGLRPQGSLPRFNWAPSLMGLDFVDLILQCATEDATQPLVRSSLEKVAAHVLKGWTGLVPHAAGPYLIQLTGRDALETRFLDIRASVWKGHGRAIGMNVNNPFV